MVAKFVAKLEKSPGKGGWTYVVWPDAAKVFGTHGAVKIRGTVDGHPIETSFMAMGNGVQMLPIKTDIRKVIKKEVGNSVEVVILERLK